MVPIAMMPVMAAINVVPGKVAVGFMVVPPAVGMKGQPPTGEVDPDIGVPAIPETVASDKGRSAS